MMPSVKQGGGYTLTFAKKNKDVQDHLEELKKNKVTITDYLCDAVRFYEKHKEDSFKPPVIDLSEVTEMIENKFRSIEKLVINSNTLGKQEVSPEEQRGLPTEESLIANTKIVGGFGKK